MLSLFLSLAIYMQVEALVAQLGDNDFRTREAASAKLLEVGSPALPRLALAASSDTDLEIQHRAERLIPEIKIKKRSVVRSSLLKITNKPMLNGWAGVGVVIKSDENESIGLTSYGSFNKFSVEIDGAEYQAKILSKSVSDSIVLFSFPKGGLTPVGFAEVDEPSSQAFVIDPYADTPVDRELNWLKNDTIYGPIFEAGDSSIRFGTFIFDFENSKPVIRGTAHYTLSGYQGKTGHFLSSSSTKFLRDYVKNPPKSTDTETVPPSGEYDPAQP